jgi:hypothetical protein
MAEKRPSYVSMLPMRAAVDTRQSATDLRLMMVVGWHDRGSLTSGVGAGCTASTKTLAAEVGCDYYTLIKRRKHLEETGYFQLEPRQGGKRLEVIRVVPDHLADPKLWPFDQSFIGEGCKKAWHARERKVGELANVSGEGVGDLDNADREKVGEPISGTRGNLPKTTPQDTSLREVRYSSKEGGRDSTEVAHFSQSASDEVPTSGMVDSSVAGSSGGELPYLVTIAANILGSQRALHQRSGVPTTYIGRAKKGESIPQAHETTLFSTCDEIVRSGIHRHPPFLRFGNFGSLLPADFDAKPCAVQLAYLQKALDQVSGHQFVADAEEAIDEHLEEISEQECGTDAGHRAQRMREELDRWLPA